MDVLDLFVRIIGRDEASDKIDDVASGAIPKLISAAKKAATALAAMWGVKKIIDFGKEAYDAYSEYEQLVGGIQKLYGNANMSLEEYARSVNKTVDEVSADYERNARAESDMLEYAANAWQTAGMDMNTYMQNATSISASLINSLGGDTVKAAEMTDVAMRAISDNVNTFGSDMDFVTHAFMGFSRQNYTMLDNLKLGYSGTREGMQKLIADANEWARANGMAADLSIESFADVVTAIEYIQKKQGIYGTTQREALSTLEGSANAFRAAWKNLVTEFGKPDANLAARIGDMFTAVFGVGGSGGILNNAVAEVKVIATNMLNAVKDGITFAADWVLSNGAKVLRNALKDAFTAIGRLANEFDLGHFDLESLIDGEAVSAALDRLTEFGTEIFDIITTWGPHVLSAVQSLFWSVVGTVQENMPTILENVGNVIDGVVQWIVDNGPSILVAVAQTILGVIEEMTSHWPEIVNNVATVIGDVIQWLIDNGPEILSAAMELFKGIGQAILDHGPQILNNIATTIGNVIGAIVGAVGRMFAAGIQFVGGLLDGSTKQGEAVRRWFADLPSRLLNALGNVGMILWDAGRAILTGFWDGLKSVWSGITDWVSGIAGTIASLKGPLPYDRTVLIENGRALMYGLQSGLQRGFEEEVEPYISALAGEIEDGMSFSPTVAYSAAGGGYGQVTNNYYIDGSAVDADPQLADALRTVAQTVSSRNRKGTVKR